MGISPSTFVIKRGDLTLVKLTLNDKLASDPTNVGPLTGNVTDCDIYTLSKKGYTIYFYDTSYKSNKWKGLYSGVTDFTS